MTILRPEDLNGEVLSWIWKNLDPGTYHLIIDRTHNALAGYKFDNDEDVVLLKLKFKI